MGQDHQTNGPIVRLVHLIDQCLEIHRLSASLIDQISVRLDSTEKLKMHECLFQWQLHLCSECQFVARPHCRSRAIGWEHHCRFPQAESEMQIL